jgi:N-acyl homoserine lactone hydrolase
MAHSEQGRANVKVTAIQTGTANLHHLHEEAPLQWNPLRRKLGILRDTQWVGPVPIYSYLIEHPEGLFVVDTGDNSRKDYMPKTNA